MINRANVDFPDSGKFEFRTNIGARPRYISRQNAVSIPSSWADIRAGSLHGKYFSSVRKCCSPSSGYIVSSTGTLSIVNTPVSSSYPAGSSSNTGTPRSSNRSRSTGCLTTFTPRTSGSAVSKSSEASNCRAPVNVRSSGRGSRCPFTVVIPSRPSHVVSRSAVIVRHCPVASIVPGTPARTKSVRRVLNTSASRTAIVRIGAATSNVTPNNAASSGRGTPAASANRPIRSAKCTIFPSGTPS